MNNNVISIPKEAKKTSLKSLPSCAFLGQSNMTVCRRAFLLVLGASVRSLRAEEKELPLP